MNNISVIIPVYNEENYIGDCLEKLLPQLRAGDEIIVIDNNSTDSSVDIVKTHSSVVFGVELRQGQAYAQATGFNMAKNNILGRIDADTMVYEGWLEATRNLMTDPDTQAVTGPGVSYDLVMGKYLSATSYWTFILFRAFIGGYPLYGTNFAIKKSTWKLIENKLSYNPGLWEDLEMGILLAKEGVKVQFSSKLKVGMSTRLNSTKWTKIITYQYRGVKTFWVCGLKMAAVINAAERAVYMSILFVPALFERLLFIARRPKA